MIRWLILAERYHRLEVFDLILGCDSVMNVLKLLWTGRSKKHPLGLGVLTSSVSLGAFAWLIIQLGIAVCVGIIGLTYNLDISSSWVFLTQGNTSVVNLPSLSSGLWLHDLADIGSWGTTGTNFGTNIDYEIDSGLSYEGANEAKFVTNQKGTSRYFFYDHDPNDSSQNDETHRFIDCTVSCTRSIVTSGQYGLQDYITFMDTDGRPHNQTLYEAPMEAGLYVVANTNSTCGDRCTNIVVFQAAVRPENAGEYDSTYGVNISQGTRFACNSTVTNVQHSSGYEYPNWPTYEISPLLSRMIAGMYGWSDNDLMDGKYLYSAFEVAPFDRTFATQPDSIDVENAMSHFTAGGLAAMDVDLGLYRLYVPNGLKPIQAQVLHVKWWAAYTLLGIIPAIQLVTCIIVIAVANKVIIKDDTPLSMAKVYWRLLRDNKLGEHGCMLDGDQLIQAVEDAHSVQGPGKAQVIYGVKIGSEEGALNHVDIFEEGGGCDPARTFVNLKREKQDVKPKFGFPEGEYDGSGGAPRKRPNRKVDAREYF